MKPFPWVVGAIVLLVACHDRTSIVDGDEAISRVEQIVGRWRALESTEIRGFGGDGTTWIEVIQPGPVPSTSRRAGTYRLASQGKLELHLEGETTTEWEVSFGRVGGRVLRMRGSDGQTHGYVDASTVPSYAPTTAGGAASAPAK